MVMIYPNVLPTIICLQKEKVVLHVFISACHLENRLSTFELVL